MFLLDKIVDRLANDVTFMVNVKNHIQKAVDAMTPHHSLLGRVYDLFKAAGLFGVAKAFTIDNTVEDYEKFRKRGSLTQDEEESRKRGLELNVAEATAADFAHRYWSNAAAGKALAQWHPSAIRVVGENRTMEYVNDMDYARLYETWNFAFITGNLDFPNLLYPKLLIPSVILADANSYLYKRVLALWLSIHFYLMASLSGHDHHAFSFHKELATLWGKINHSYSNYLQEKHHWI